MLKKWFLILLTISLFIFGTNFTTQAADFRNASWGMSKSQVKNNETQEIVLEENDLLIFEDELMDFPTDVVYIFVENKLVRTKYFITQQHTNENKFINDYDNLKEALISKYGEPTQDDHFWSNDLYKSDYEYWGMALSLGHHSYFTTWDTDKTEILLYLVGDNYSINFGIDYYSKEYSDLEKEKNEEETQNKL